MAKAVYKAVRTSQFMPIDRGNEWVVIEPNGMILDVFADTGIYKMTQNEAIRIAKELNKKYKTEISA